MHHSVSRRAVIIGGLTALAGCAGVSRPGTSGTEQPDYESSGADSFTTSSSKTGQAVPTTDEQRPVEYSFDELRGAVKVGAQQGAIPAIDDPRFVRDGDAEIDDEDLVFGIDTGDTVKAYPRSILVWHEVVNDTVDGSPVAVTYCPLTGTVLGFERGETTFGVSGRLVNNNLVMFDSATGSWWSQILGTAFKGPHEGDFLREFPLVWTNWRRWRMEHPDTLVMTRDTGYVRNYDSDPYGRYVPKDGYYSDSNTLFPTLAEDDRFHPKHVVIGTRGPAGPVAIDKRTVEFEGLVPAGSYLAVHDRDLDTVYLYHNPEGLTFEQESGAVVGPMGRYRPSALPLPRAMAFDAMWFAWVGFYPETTVYP